MEYSDKDAQHGDWTPSDRDGPEAWRGEALETWPEEFAGPEYWAYRHREEVERVVSELVGERTAKDR